MKAIQLTHLVNSPSELTVADLPDPSPSQSKYTVRIYATAANFFDILQIQGKHQSKPTLPWIAGTEFAGEIVDTPGGLGSTGKGWKFKVGDKVFGATLGAFATKVLVDEVALRPIPKSWSFADACGLFYTAPTAYAALVLRAHAKSGDYVLVHGAAGALGLTAIQISRALGLFVIALVNSAKKGTAARRFGADYVIDSTKSWEDDVRGCTPNRRGVDIVFDPLGMIQRSLKTVRWGARLLVIGFAAGKIETIPTNQYLLKNVSVSGLFWGMYATQDPQAVVVIWDLLLKAINEGKIKPMIYTEAEFVGLDKIPQALDLLTSGEAWGKIVVHVPQEKEIKI